MRFSRLLYIAALFMLGIKPLVWAQISPLNAEEEAIHRAETDLWLDAVFGHCLSQVAGATWSDHPAELSSDWSELRPDYASTLLSPLYDPKQSALRGSVIIDLNPEATSCWTQYTSLVPDYAASELAEVRDELVSEDRLKTAFVDQGYGPQQVEVILVGEARVPVIFYQAESGQGPVQSVVTILQKTVPDFVYVD